MDTLRIFMKDVLEVKPPYGDLMHNGIPGQGAANPAADQTNVLYRSAQAYAVAYKDPTANRQSLQPLAADVEAAVMLLATYNVLSDNKAAGLIDKLYATLDAKSS